MVYYYERKINPYNRKRDQKRAKRRAKAEGRSVSAIVEELINSVYGPTDEELAREQQMAEAGMDDWAKNLE